jgi:hypothetical protein
MLISIDTTHDGPREYRAISAALLMLAGDIPEMDASAPSAAPIGTLAELQAEAGTLPFPQGFSTPVPAPTTLRSEAEVRTFFGAGTQAQNLPKEDTTLYATPPLPPAPTPMPPISGNVFRFPQAPPLPGPVVSATTYPPLAESTAASMAVSVNIPQPPAPPPPPVALATNVGVAAAGASLINPSPPATLAANTAEVDRSGLPWDGRIHQKGKSQKKDGTWKLQKGLDPAFAQQVVQELSARRVAPHAGNPAELVRSQPTPIPAVLQSYSNFPPPPPPPPSVPLPPSLANSYGGVPVPPPPSVSPNLMVPPPPPAPNVQVPAPGAVPQPPQPAVDAAAGSVPPYKRLMDWLTAVTRNNTLDPRIVMPTVQECGAPNLAALGTPSWEHLIPAVEAAFASKLNKG